MVCVVLALAWFTPSAQAAGKCQLQLMASFDMGTDETGAVYIPMSVGGQKVNMLIDTGAVDTMLTESAVAKLGLPSKLIGEEEGVVYGGTHINRYTDAHDIALGGMTAKTFRVAILPDKVVPSEIGGLLAPDIMRGFDVDFDFANAKVNLISPDHCEGTAVYWTRDPYATIAFRSDEGHMTVPIQLDGQTIRATIDTGASVSVMSLELAEDLFKLDTKNPDLKKTSETGQDYHYPFKSLTFQDISVLNPDLVLVPDAVSKTHGNVPLLIGMNILRKLHLYIAYGESRIYATPATSH